MTTLPLTEAKTRLNELVESAVSTHERITITRHGKPAAVIIAVEDIQSMEETIYWQSQEGARKDVDNARLERDRDELWDEASVRRRYGVGSA